MSTTCASLTNNPTTQAALSQQDLTGSVTASPRLLAVVGATGRQGGALIAALGSDSSIDVAVRAIVRDPRTPAASAISARVHDVAVADVDDTESLTRAFDGADAAYCVTPPSGPGDDPRTETVRAANMATAARDAGLQHVVWSTQEDTRALLAERGSDIPELAGGFRVPSYDAKGAADEIFRQLRVPTTFMRTSFYWESLFNPYVGPVRTPDGALAIRWPLGAAKLPGIAVADIGACAAAIFTEPSLYVGRTLGLSGEHLSGFEIAAALQGALGVACAYEPIEPDEYRRLPFAGAAAIANMFQYKRDFELTHRAYRNPDVARSLDPRLKTFEEWLHDDRTLSAFRERLELRG
jgi:uncharacterized protein YbjT (DUF2867 family)